jgi:hypothetical protein
VSYSIQCSVPRFSLRPTALRAAHAPPARGFRLVAGGTSMRSLAEDRLDPSRPALIVTYGTTSRKHRALDRDVVVVGRAPGCDVALASPEVAPVHCILARGPQGWRVRDCSGRGGTRVNGTVVVEGPLKHGDTLQVGAFSFEAHLPEPMPEPGAAEPPVAAIAVPADETSISGGGEAEARRMDIRAKELAQFAEHLRRHEQEVNTRLSQRHEEVARAETALREQRAEVVRRMSEAARAGQNTKSKSDSSARQDAEALRMQLAMVRQEIAGRDSIIAGLRLRLEQLERDQPARQSLERDQEEIARQREEIAELVAKLEEQRADLIEATREAELQSARERAQLARDRAELQQIFEDFRYEQQTIRPKEEQQTSAAAIAQLPPDVVTVRPVTRTPVPNSGSHPNASKWIEFGNRDDLGR